jgi:hypothetical protein
MCGLSGSTSGGFRIGCPEEQLEETVLAMGSVAGCGRRAVFVQRADRWLSSRSGAAEAQ